MDRRLRDNATQFEELQAEVIPTRGGILDGVAASQEGLQEPVDGALGEAELGAEFGDPAGGLVARQGFDELQAVVDGPDGGDWMGLRFG